MNEYGGLVVGGYAALVRFLFGKLFSYHLVSYISDSCLRLFLIVVKYIFAHIELCVSGDFSYFFRKSQHLFLI